MISSAPINFKSFFGILFLIFTLVYLHTTPCQAQSQSFVYTLNTNEDASINDAVEAGGKYIFVGWKNDSANIEEPYLFELNANGDFLRDTTIDFEGYFCGIYNHNDGYILISSLTAVHGDPLSITTFTNQTDLNLVTTNILDEESYSAAQNCTLINDSNIAIIGLKTYNFGFISTVKLINVDNPDPNDEEVDISGSNYPIKCYSFVKLPNSNKLFTNNWLSDTDLVRVITLTGDDSLNIIDTSYVSTSYSQFGNSNLTGPVSVMSLTDSTFMIDGLAPHSLSANSTDSLDVAQMIWDKNNNELSLNFLGAADTNEYASPHSISKGEGHFYLGNTKNYNPSVTGQPSYFMLTKTDSLGNPLWTKYYGNGTRLKLTKVLATSDGGALLIGSSQALSPGSVQKVYVVKIDASGTLSGLKYPNGKNEFTTVLFPNPSTSEIHFSTTLPEAQKATLQIYNDSGKLIRELPFTNDLNLNVSNYSRGGYLYRILSVNGYSAGRFVVDR